MKTDKPTGLKITRDGTDFKITWKKGETYDDGQELQYKLYTAKGQKTADSGRNFLSQGFEITGTKWVDLNISKTATSKTLSLSANSYYPNTKVRIYGVAFRVRGNRGKYTKGSGKNKKTYNPGWSDWAEKTVIIRPPKAPSISSSWDGNPANRSTYTWEAKSEKWRPATNVLFQTITKQDCPTKNLDSLKEWKTATKETKSLTGSKYYDETGLSGISKARVVRIRARGLGGYSEKWVYAFHVFAAPLAVKNLEGKALYNATTHVWDLSATWQTSGTQTHPVDEYMLQYRIGKPIAGMGVTADGSWTDTSPTTKGDMAAQATEALSDDECLWLRVTAAHDNHSGANAIACTPIRAYTGKPAAPTNLAISASDPGTHEVTIAVTNNSAITDSKVAIVFQPTTDPQDSVVVAVLTGSGNLSQAGIKCPDWTNTGTLGFAAYAYVGDETYATQDGVKHYNVIPIMQSETIFTTGGIPKAPTTVKASKDGDDIKVEWDWAWTDANAAEVSWSTRRTAWNSNSGPDTYEVSATGPAHLYLTGLETGKTYYIRVRLLAKADGETTFGPYSDTMTVYLSAAPVTPALDLSAYSINEGDEITATWSYVSADGTPQAYAKILEKSGAVYSEIARAATEQQITFTPGWAEDTQHELYLQVVSEAGVPSPLSNAQIVTVVSKPTCSITQTSLVAGADGNELQEMPFTVTVTGAGTAGTTLIQVVRAADFVEERPGGEDFHGFVGQVIVRRVFLGEDQQTFELEDLAGHLDDTAEYRLVAQVTDGNGQTAEDAVDFTVNWTQQPVKPEAAVSIVDTAAYIYIYQPAGSNNTDTVDIYRLSVDGPELIYRDASFGDVVVDPYPVIGEYGGYRIALKTKNGDYYTADKEPAWIDIDAGFESISQYIDFGGYQLPITYNVDLDISFTKNFKKTTYLGGNEAGYYLEGISRTGGIAAALITEEDTDDIQTLRALGRYQGLAHIRTKDGASYWANVNTTENLDHMSCRMYKSVTLQIEAVKEDRQDGMLRSEWEVSA